MTPGEMPNWRIIPGAIQGARPGKVNWMTAGKGIIHSERTTPT